MPPSEYNHPQQCYNATRFLTTKALHTSINKDRSPVTVVRWAPDGRRLITGCHTGELTLWNGVSFNFETIQQAHDIAIRAMCWNRQGTFMVSGDQSGLLKYWQTSMATA